MKIEVDKSVWNKMKKNLSKGENMSVGVGFFESDKYANGLPVAQVAKWNEEGHINGPGSQFPGSVTPPRPFLKNNFMEPIKKGMYDSYFIESIQRIAEGKSTFSQEYKKIGKMAKEDLQEVILDFDTPANSPITEMLKGFNNPLVETGKMYESVGFMLSTSSSKED